MRLHIDVGTGKALEGFSGLNAFLLGVFVLLSSLANGQSKQKDVQIIQAYHPFQIKCDSLKCRVYRSGEIFSGSYQTIKYEDGEIMVWDKDSWWYFEAYGDEYRLESERVYYRVCEKMPSIDGCSGLIDIERIFCIERTIREELNDSGIMSSENWDEVDISPYVLKVFFGKNGQIHRVEPFKSMPDIELENEILQFVKDYEGWSGGSQGGLPVNVRYVLPLKHKKKE